MGIRIGIGSLKIGQGSTGVDWSSYWTALKSAMTNKPSMNYSLAANKFIKALDVGGVWDDLDFLNVKWTPSNEDGEALINWINPTGDKMAPLGDGSLVFYPYEGIKNGVAAYLNTNFNASTAKNYKRDDACAFFYGMTAGQDSRYDYGALSGTSLIVAMSRVSGAGLGYNRLNTNAYATDATNTSPYTGLFLLNRTSSSVVDMWMGNEKKVTKSPNNSTGVPNLNIYEFTINQATISTYKVAQHGILGFGKSLTDEKIAILNSAIATFYSEIQEDKKLSETNWTNSRILSDEGTFKKRNSFSEYKFTYSGTRIFIKANPTIYSYSHDQSILIIYVNGVRNQAVAVAAFSNIEVTLPAGDDKLVSIMIPGNAIPSGIILGVYPTEVYGTSALTLVPQSTVNDKCVFVGDSITNGWNASIPDTLGYARLFASESSKTIANYSVGGWKLADIAATTELINETVADIVNLFSNVTGTKRLSILIGVNDSVASATFGNYYAALLDAINVADSSIDVFCVTPFMETPTALNQQYRDVINTVCGTRSFTTYINSDLVGLSGADYDTSPHLSDVGHKKLKDYLYAIIYPA